jgi:hypothetical protein
VRPDPKARPEYVGAVREIILRIESSLVDVPKRLLPVKMYIAGGAAVHFYTGARVSKDIDAVFSRRIVLPENLEVAYRDPDGKAHLVYFDRQYNDTLALMHEDTYEDSVELSLQGIDAGVLDVRLLSSIDLAVSKISRFAEHDREDIQVLAQKGLVNAKALRQRAEEAVAGYVGNMDRLRGSIDLACRIVEDAERLRRR